MCGQEFHDYSIIMRVKYALLWLYFKLVYVKEFVGY